MNSRGRYRAADLLDVLIQGTIMLILLGILWPVFGRARENARRASCQSNLKQIGLGIMQYTQDYDERYPVGSPTTIQRKSIGWAGEIYPYVKSVQIYVCPSATTLGATTTTGASPISYALNTFIADKSMAAIDESARDVMLSETNNKISAF